MTSRADTEQQLRDLHIRVRQSDAAKLA